MPRCSRCSMQRGGCGWGFTWAIASWISRPGEAALQHLDPGRKDGADRRQLPQDPSARPCRPRAGAPFQHLEKRYFEVGDLGFPAWARSAAARRHGDLQRPALARDLPRAGAAGRRDGPPRLQHAGAQPGDAGARPISHFHNQLVMQAGAYQNGTWVVGVAKAGVEEGVDQIGQSYIVAPSGEIARRGAPPLETNCIARCDLDLRATRPPSSTSRATAAGALPPDRRADRGGRGTGKVRGSFLKKRTKKLLSICG